MEVNSSKLDGFFELRRDAETKMRGPVKVLLLELSAKTNSCTCRKYSKMAGQRGILWMDGNQIKMPFWDEELSQLHLCLLSTGHGIGHLHCLSCIEVILQVLDKEFPPQNTMMSLWGTSRLTILKNVNQIAAIQLRWLQGLCASAGRSCQNVYQILTRLRHSANCTWATVWSVMKHVSSQRTVYLCFG